MSGFVLLTISRRRTVALLAACLLAVGALAGAATGAAAEGVIVIRSTVTGSDGKPYSVTNHLLPQARVPAPGHLRKEWLLAWAGDAAPGAGGSPDPDFLAVIDATPGTPDYGKVVNTVTIDSVTGNEPHHMQYIWHKGEKVYAGGIFSDTAYVFDVTRLPRIALSGITLPADTPCGSAPDAFQVLRDGTAYGTYMGGPDVSGPCTYTDGQTRTGNGFAGSPGEIVHIGPDGKVLGEAPAASTTSEGASCADIPALQQPTCANPHGVAVREDLHRLVTSDFAEVRDLLADQAPTANVGRDTVRIFDIANRNDPRLVSVSHLPDGPRPEPIAAAKEHSEAMETAVPHARRHRGAFASTMGGGVIYYTPDITDPHPRWREVFDDETAFTRLFPTDTPTSSLDGGAWLQTSLDDRYLFHVVLTGGMLGSPPAHAEEGMVYTLDIQALLRAGSHTRCKIDTLAEVSAGGREPDCPKLVSAVPLNDPTTGGPHWASMDNFRAGWTVTTTRPRRPAGSPSRSISWRAPTSTATTGSACSPSTRAAT
ncbi:hypothetical protein GCM10029978_055320 [Actinoallomurus acanthiterrae]